MDDRKNQDDQNQEAINAESGVAEQTEVVEKESAPVDEPAGEVEPVIVDEDQLLQLAEKEGLNDLVDRAADAHEEAIDLNLSAEEEHQLMAGMEAILFMSDRPVSLPKLRSYLRPEVALPVYRELMGRLREEFAQNQRGVEIAEVSLGFQLRTKPHMSGVLRKMVKTQPLKLSPTSMEVLSIIAYKQPLPKDEIDQIRGVDSGYVLRNLMEKRLIRISGRSDLPGKPMLYGTTHEFLELFNLKDLKALPSLHEVEAMVAASEVGFEEKSQKVMQEFSKVLENSKQVLFDDSKIDEELEAIRQEISSIRTSTDFIDSEKEKEKQEAKIAELAAQGLTLDAEGKVVPLAAHQPSAELVQEAQEAQWERHSQMIQAAKEDAKSEAFEDSTLVLEASEVKEAT